MTGPPPTRLAAHRLADPLRWGAASTAFVNSMSDLFHDGFSNEQIAAVFGIMADKDIDSVIAPLLARVDLWHIASLPPPRGATVSELRKRLEIAGVAPSAIRDFGDPASAYRAAREAVSEADRIIVFGSFLTVAAALAPTDRRAA